LAIFRRIGGGHRRRKGSPLLELFDDAYPPHVPERDGTPPVMAFWSRAGLSLPSSFSSPKKNCFYRLGPEGKALGNLEASNQFNFEGGQ
jgi:hypothetical protein